MIFPCLRCWAASVAMLVLLSSSALAEQTKPPLRLEPVPGNAEIPLSDFLRPGFIFAPQLKNSGTHVAAMTSLDGDRTSLIVIELASGAVSGFEGFTDGSVLFPQWLTDKKLLMTLNFGGNMAGGLFAADIENLAEAYPVLQLAGFRALRTPRENPLKPLVPARWWGIDDNAGVVRVDAGLRRGEWVPMNKRSPRVGNFMPPKAMEKIGYLNREHVVESYLAVPGTGWGAEYYADRDGKLAFARNIVKGRNVLYQWNGDSWVESTVDLSRVKILSVEDNPDAVVVIWKGEPGSPGAVLRINGLTGEVKETLYRAGENERLGDAYLDPVHGGVLGVGRQLDLPRQVWFDEHMAEIDALARQALKGQVIELLDHSVDRKVFLLRATTDRQPSTFYTINTDTKKLALVKSARPWLDPARMARTHAFQYRTESGIKLDAFLTLPIGTTKSRPAPLVVRVDGNAFAHANQMFDAETQLWASRGYAVLSLNHRGGEGSAWQFGPDAIWDFNGITDDVVAATRTAIKTGLIDEDRLAITGARRGGYLALRAAQRAPGLFKVALVNSAIFDWNSTIKQRRQRAEFDPEVAAFFAHFSERVGDKAYWNALSPLYHEEPWTTAVHLAHSKEDFETPFQQAKAFAKALEQAGVPHQTLFADEPGAFMVSDLTNRETLYRSWLDFLDQHL